MRFCTPESVVQACLRVLNVQPKLKRAYPSANTLAATSLLPRSKSSPVPLLSKISPPAQPSGTPLSGRVVNGGEPDDNASHMQRGCAGGAPGIGMKCPARTRQISKRVVPILLQSSVLPTSPPRLDAASLPAPAAAPTTVGGVRGVGAPQARVGVHGVGRAGGLCTRWWWRHALEGRRGRGSTAARRSHAPAHPTAGVQVVAWAGTIHPMLCLALGHGSEGCLSLPRGLGLGSPTCGAVAQLSSRVHRCTPCRTCRAYRPASHHPPPAFSPPGDSTHQPCVRPSEGSRRCRPSRANRCAPPPLRAAATPIGAPASVCTRGGAVIPHQGQA